VNFIIFIHNWKNCSESIVGGTSLHNELSIGDPVYKNRIKDECFLKRVKSIMTRGVKLPRDIFLGKADQWNDDVQIVKDKLVIKICKT